MEEQETAGLPKTMANHLVADMHTEVCIDLQNQKIKRMLPLAFTTH